MSDTHIAVCPSAGIGHLIPFLRLSSMLASCNSCKVTLVVIRPTLSTAEDHQINTFLTTHPHISSSEFHALLDDSTDPTIDDPFLRQYSAVSRSSHVLINHLSALSPPVSAVFFDLLLASGLSKGLAELGIPQLTVITSSARFFSLMTQLNHRGIARGEDVEIPGLAPISGDDVPPMIHKRDHAFTRLIETNCWHLREVKGVVLNSFDFLETESITALQSGKVLSDLPPVFPLGPLNPLKVSKGSNCISWLDDQPSESVVFVSFGSRTAMTKDQLRELGDGLQRIGVMFLWVVKAAIVDKDDKEELSDLLGEAFFKRTKNRGLIVKEWVNQEEILAHPSIGGFVTHCGWNSVMEAAQRGIPLLAWPLHGDQRVNAGVVEAAGLGIWERGWGWGGERLVQGAEIAHRIEELMTSENLRDSARGVGEEARKAWEICGSSRNMFNMMMDLSMRKMDM